MASLNFPTNPVNGQIYPSLLLPGTNIYQYDAPNQTWRLVGTASGVASGTYGNNLTCVEVTVTPSGVISDIVNRPIPTSDSGVLGLSSPGIGLSAVGGVFNLNPPTAGQIGGVRAGTNVSINASGAVSVATASTSIPGIVKLNDTLTSSSVTEALTAAQGKTLQDQVNTLATPSGVTPNTYGDAVTCVEFTVTARGVISNAVNRPIPTSGVGVLGLSSPGDGLDVTAGVYNLIPPLSGKIGGVKQGTNVTISADGTISVASASTSTQGVVQLNNTVTSTSTDEALTAYQGKLLQDQIDAITGGGLAPPGTYGDNVTCVEVTVDSEGFISNVVNRPIPTAASGVNGLSSPGTGLSSAGGTYNLQPPLLGNIGGVKAGTNVTIAGDGTVSVSTASTSVPGVVQLNNTVSSISTTQALTAYQGKLLQDQISALAVDTLKLCGVYNASTSQLVYVTQTGTDEGFVTGNNLPVPAANLYQTYVIVSTPGTPTYPAPQVAMSAGDWIVYNGVTSEWQLLPVGGQTGTVSRVDTGTGLTGGPILTTGTISLAAGGVTNTEISPVAAIESDKLQFTPQSAFATARTVQSKLRDVVSVRDFGMLPSNTAAQNTAAMENAVSALNSGQVKGLYIPAGIYKVDGTFTVSAAYFSIYGDGPRASILAPTENQDVLILSSSNPADPNPELARINDFSLLNFGIDYGNSTGTRRGCAIALVRPGRGYVNNLDLRGCYQGMAIQGAFSLLMSNLYIGGFSDPIASQIGSFSIKFSPYPGVGVSGNNTEVFISNFNFLSTGIQGNMGEHSIVIESGDGIWFNNGHCGFVEKSDIYINTDSSSFLTDIYFQDVYCDGHLTTTTDTSGAVYVAGANTSLCGGIYFRTCSFRNHYNKPAIEVDGRATLNLSVIDCQFVDNGRGGIVMSGASGNLMKSTQIINNYFYNNEIANSGDSVISINFADMTTIANNTIVGVSATPPSGISVGSGCTNTYVATNIIRNCTSGVSDSGTNSLVNSQLLAV